jgi:hypothetical protein
MTQKKGWGSTVAGWFIVQDATSASGDETASDAQAADGYNPFSDLAADGSPKPPADPPLAVFKTAPPEAPGGQVDFDNVFEAAGIGAEERERVSRTLGLLTDLPPGTDETVKKQIVMASLRAFKVPVEKIIESGAQELQALEAYIRAGAADVEKVTMEADQRIKQYEEEIGRLKTVMQQRVDEQNKVMASCNTKKLDVQKVLEFFGQEAVARVVRESPKLQEPSH